MVWGCHFRSFTQYAPRSQILNALAQARRIPLGLPFRPLFSLNNLPRSRIHLNASAEARHIVGPGVARGARVHGKAARDHCLFWKYCPPRVRNIYFLQRPGSVVPVWPEIGFPLERRVIFHKKQAFRSRFFVHSCPPLERNVCLFC